MQVAGKAGQTVNQKANSANPDGPHHKEIIYIYGGKGLTWV